MRAGRIPPDSAHRYPTPRSVLLFGMTLPNSVLFIARMHHVDMVLMGLPVSIHSIFHPSLLAAQT
ncbi:hypothetical protein OUZ56_003002 [Daphnia magna]|uniref:Uncharacterized protein n=1 Tax=Daphnia magna TaxID=35525 RepID=A0ABR0A7G1_9CRUS|nr:hypothetical protein OUZ56_003002 [Daphnia magna]